MDKGEAAYACLTFTVVVLLLRTTRLFDLKRAPILFVFAELRMGVEPLSTSLFPNIEVVCDGEASRAGFFKLGEVTLVFTEIDHRVLVTLASRLDKRIVVDVGVLSWVDVSGVVVFNHEDVVLEHEPTAFTGVTAPFEEIVMTATVGLSPKCDEVVFHLYGNVSRRNTVGFFTAGKGSKGVINEIVLDSPIVEAVILHKIITQVVTIRIADNKVRNVIFDTETVARSDYSNPFDSGVFVARHVDRSMVMKRRPGSTAAQARAVSATREAKGSLVDTRNKGSTIDFDL